MNTLVALILFSVLPAYSLTQVPSRCLQSEAPPCQVKTQRTPQAIRWKGSVIWLGRESMVELGVSGVHVLQGDVWLQTREETPFKTSYVTGTIKGNIWLRQDLKRSLVRRLSGDLFLRLRAGAKTVVLPVGFENWYSGLQTDRQVFEGILRPMPEHQLLAEWVRDFRVPVKISRSLWVSWTNEWSGNIELGSAIYRSSVDRHLASVETQQRRRDHMNREAEAERLQLLQIYRRKNGIEAFSPSSEGPNSLGF